MKIRSLLAAAFAAAATLPAAAQSPAPFPPIRHVFTIVLENEGYDTTFNDHPRAPYFADTLRKSGAMLREYYGIGHVSLDNYIAMISGLAPNYYTQSDCPMFIEFAETGMGPDGQPIGRGCVYPSHVQTVANQLESHGLSWKAFMEDMGNTPTREPGTCGHPPIGGRDSTARATPADQYATKHNPFVYFHAVIDSASCQKNVVPLPGLEQLLKSADKTPNYVFISPNLCHDGHDRPCKNGEPGSLESADAFLKHWVPMITSSAAFKKDGLLIITFDEALSIDPRACCNEQPGPNTLHPGGGGPGGGRTGAVLLSPFIRAGTVSDEPYNHYSMLRSIEDIFGLPHLGYAGQDGLRPFGSDVFTQPGGPKGK